MIADYSAQHVYKLDAAARQIQEEHLSLEEAIGEVDKLGMAAKQESEQT